MKTFEGGSDYVPPGFPFSPEIEERGGVSGDFNFLSA